MIDGTKPSLTWFSAHLIFESQAGHATKADPLCEDRVVLFRAAGLNAARASAEAYGRKEAHNYRNGAGELVTWSFIRVDDLDELGPELDEEGWEVASRLFRPSDMSRQQASER